jgi:HEAT repeat protein
MTHSIIAMGKTGDSHVVPQLLEYLWKGDSTARSQASLGLLSLGKNIWNLDEVGEKIVPDLLIALYDKDHALRVSAIWALHWLAESGQLNTPELRDRSVQTLIDLLSDENDDVRLSAIYALKCLRDNRAVPQLIEHCLNDENRLIAIEAANMLGNVKDKRAVPSLLETLRSATDPMVRHSVILALGSLEDARAIQPLADLLLGGDSLRGYAAVSLGEIGDQRSTPLLLETLLSDQSLEVRELIVLGLGLLRDKHAVPNLTRILGAVGDEAGSTRRLRWYAVSAMRLIGDEAALPALIEAIDKAPELQIRMAAVDALEHVTSSSKAALLLSEILLHHEVDYVRSFAARALGFLAANSKDSALSDYIVSNLIRGLSDTGKGGHYEARVSDEAARSLQFIGTPEALAAINRWRQSPDS